MRLRALAAAVLVAGTASVAFAQSAQPALAEVARAEEARRAKVAAPAKVYTNDNLKPDFTTPTPPPPAPSATTVPVTEIPLSPEPPSHGAPAVPGAAAAPAAATPRVPPTPTNESGAVEKANTEAFWRNRITQARAELERSQTFAQALQNRVDALWTDFVNRDNPVERSVIEQNRIKALDELARVQKDIEANTKAVRAVEEEARRNNVPPGWLRP